jgi:putative endopeptidase
MPLKSVLETCLGARTDVTATLAALKRDFGVSALFSTYSSPDKKNAKKTICAMSQSGLGLPDRDYYFDADKADKRTHYVLYIASVLRMCGDVLEAAGAGTDYKSVTGSRAAAERILSFETDLAEGHLSRTEMRDPEATYNMMSPSDLAGKIAAAHSASLSWGTYLTSGTTAFATEGSERGLDFRRYLMLLGVPECSQSLFNVSSVPGVVRAAVLSTRLGSGAPSTQSLVEYLLFTSIDSMGHVMTKALSTAKFQFFETQLKGTEEQQPRWKRALGALEDALGEALGKLYVAKFFKPAAKEKALEIVGLVREALRQRIHEVEWMSDATRTEALKKLDTFKVKLGYPDHFRDYSALVVTRGKHFENVVAARSFSFQVDLARMGRATDRERWFMTPQTVNAYYHPLLNEIVFPAAILQAPFFDAEADDAANFGTFGAVAGHEMTHGFDDAGRQYDSEGNLRDWWAGEDGNKYNARAEVMVAQAEQHEVHGMKLKGKLTCGENIADLGGLRLAYRALDNALKAAAAAGEPDTPINGYTARQRFFLSWASAWRQNATIEREKQLVTVDPHGPNEFRANGPLRNMAEFYEAFGIEVGDEMYMDPKDRVDIW